MAGVSGNGITISNFSHIPIAASSTGGSAGGGSVSVVGANSGISSGGGQGATSAAGSGVIVGGDTVNGGATGAASVQTANGGQTSSQSQFLLARLLTSALEEKAQAELEVQRADR